MRGNWRVEKAAVSKVLGSSICLVSLRNREPCDWKVVRDEVRVMQR